MTTSGETMYFNLICEEICLTGGKIIHIDENKESLEDVHNVVKENILRYPNAKWELHVMGIAL